MKNRRFYFTCGLCLLLFLHKPLYAFDQNHCIEVMGFIEDGDTTITQEEKIRLWEEQLFAAIDKREQCLQEKHTQNSSSAAKGEGAKAGTDEKRHAAKEREKTVTRETQEASQEGTLEEETIHINTEYTNAAAHVKKDVKEEKTIPEDIVPPDDDDILKKIIYKKASEEKDPKIREKLWEEYRKYE